MSWKCCYSNVHFLYTPAKMDLTTRLEACLLAGTDSDCRFFPSEAECSAFLRQQPACVLDMTCSVRVRLVTPLDVSNDHHSVLPLATNAAVPPNSTPFDHVNWTWNVVVWVLMGCFAVSFLAVILVYHRRRLRQLFTNKSNQSEGSDDDDDDGGTHVVLYTDRTSAPHRPCNHQDLTTITSTTTTTSTAPSFPPDDPPPLVVCAQLAEQPLDFGDLPLWRLDETHLLMTTVLSIGLHGLVAKGTYKGRRVAIKKLLPPRHPQSTTQSVQLFLDEIKLLSELDSPYIVSLVGVCWDQPRDVVVVMDYMSRGDLRTFLQQRLEFPWTQKIDCAGDVCRGLVYLHSMEVVHRDLKSRNVLLNANMVAKLSDFGLARHVDDYELTLGNVVGSFRYAAPEVLRGELYTEAADMYALGMLLWELDTHEVPFSAMQRQLKCTAMDVYKYMLAHADEWLHVTELCPAKVVDVIKMCTQADPKQRPTAVVLASVLDRLNVAS
ncbi:hypothetical protein DYB37_007570 [Aphanomyces astaci]|uniref:Protein kinase domain-containing protein n=2 Tax=Aphanomyces astaci TaxID=112090 RepID=A0A397DE29_APHAT|nr:hypothetical protein DYB25_001236 [Aphanomyces astaci]RHY59866.1 hypothetical protein DYB30_002198 [Aphanomyces astaci]RHY69750.1 hypothetical protein DYB34_003030 [Aphanomyces astaci]RHY80782.1 hypothetical protein DYB31_001687 [Aphanomyces astaci]RHY88084.1 hypothetical protein DYB35_008988 [Aphanomyces astaci]